MALVNRDACAVRWSEALTTATRVALKASALRRVRSRAELVGSPADSGFWDLLTVSARFPDERAVISDGAVFDTFEEQPHVRTTERASRHLDLPSVRSI